MLPSPISSGPSGPESPSWLVPRVLVSESELTTSPSWPLLRQPELERQRCPLGGGCQTVWPVGSEGPYVQSSAGRTGPRLVTHYFLRLFSLSDAPFIFSPPPVCIILASGHLSTVCDFLHSYGPKARSWRQIDPANCVPQDHADVTMPSSLTLPTPTFCAWCRMDEGRDSRIKQHKEKKKHDDGDACGKVHGAHPTRRA